MQVQTTPIRGEIWVRWGQFRLLTKSLGYGTDEARAQFAGISVRQLSRAKSRRVGDEFVASVMAAFARTDLRVTFEDLFEIRTREAAA